jgi:hypothetical protein
MAKPASEPNRLIRHSRGELRTDSPPNAVRSSSRRADEPESFWYTFYT